MWFFEKLPNDPEGRGVAVHGVIQRDPRAELLAQAVVLELCGIPYETEALKESVERLPAESADAVERFKADVAVMVERFQVGVTRGSEKQFEARRQRFLAGPAIAADIESGRAKIVDGRLVYG